MTTTKINETTALIVPNRYEDVSDSYWAYCSNCSEQIKSAIDNREYKNVIFDFEPIAYMEDHILGLAISTRKFTYAVGGKVAIAYSNEHVLQVFRLLGFSEFFYLCNTIEEALEKINQTSS
jgi:anti-anti-sigma factor